MVNIYHHRPVPKTAGSMEPEHTGYLFIRFPVSPSQSFVQRLQNNGQLKSMRWHSKPAGHVYPCGSIKKEIKT